MLTFSYAYLVYHPLGVSFWLKSLQKYSEMLLFLIFFKGQPTR